jgi:hypothetical protein
MAPEVSQAILVAVALGAMISAWAYLHFHAPYPAEEIRCSVSPRRYILAVSIHVCGILAIYCILVFAVYPVLMQLMYGSENHVCWKCLECEDCGLDEQAIIWAALISALTVRFLMPKLPLTRQILEQMRSFAHRLALFPAARESVVACVAVTGFCGSDDAHAELVEELATYGISSYSTAFLSKSALLRLMEVCSLRRRLQKLADKATTQTMILRRVRILASFWFRQRQQEKQAIADHRRLVQFWQGRAAAWAQLETDFRRLLRRSARALLFIDDIKDQAPEKTVRVAISNFVIEESDDVLTRYRRLIAELVLFCESRPDRQEALLKSFGYPARIPLSLPLRPWIVVFVLDLILFLVPLLVMPLMQFTHITNENPPIPVARPALFAFVHAVSQTLAITWAIYPKVTSNFARPSLYSLPWQSYIIYGIASYLSGAAILLLFRLNVPIDFPIVLPTLVSSCSFLLMTVGISFLIDRHLRSGPDDIERRRLQDGAVMGLLMLLGTSTFQLIVFYVAPWLGWVHLESRPPLIIRASFLVLSGSLGFVMGYIVPSTAARYFRETSLVPPAYWDSHSRPGILRHSA